VCNRPGGPRHAARISANKLERAVLRERNPSPRWFTRSFKFQIALLISEGSQEDVAISPAVLNFSPFFLGAIDCPSIGLESPMRLGGCDSSSRPPRKVASSF
jgi:hypothetical protein